MDNGTAEAAQTAQKTAETEQGKAETAEMTAETEKGNAEMAEMEAMTAAGTHVIGLLMAANAVGVEDDPETPAVDERAEAVDGRSHGDR